VTRLFAAIVLIGIVIATIWLLPSWITLVLAAVVAALASSELAGLASNPGGNVPGRLFAFFSAMSAASLCVAFAVVPEGGVPHALGIVLMASMVVIGAIRLFSGPPAPVPPWAIMLMALVYIGLPLGALSKIQFLYGPRVFTVLFVLVAVSDSAQYYAGRAFGRRKLAPSVSPAKTLEGALGGLAGAALVGAILGPRWIPNVTAVTGSALGLTLGAFGIVGDLFESLLKRGAGVKDSSSLIPGHGGLLDRIDSWLFVAPIYYGFLRYLA
jgi:phosphatidate cytidylyltransferase